MGVRTIIDLGEAVYGNSIDEITSGSYTHNRRSLLLRDELASRLLSDCHIKGRQYRVYRVAHARAEQSYMHSSAPSARVVGQ